MRGCRAITTVHDNSLIRLRRDGASENGCRWHNMEVGRSLLHVDQNQGFKGIAMLLGMAGKEWMGLGWFLLVVGREQVNNLFGSVPVMAELKILPFLIDA